MYSDCPQYKQKGFAPIIILVGILILAGIAGGIFYITRLNTSKISSTQKVTPIAESLDKSSTKTSTPFLQILNMFDTNTKKETSNNYQEIFMRMEKVVSLVFLTPRRLNIKRLNP